MERLERPSLQDGIGRAGALRVWVESAWPPLVGLAGLMNYCKKLQFRVVYPASTSTVSKVRIMCLCIICII